MQLIKVRLTCQNGLKVAEIPMDADEMKQLKKEACRAIMNVAKKLLPEGCDVQRLTYVDDEADHCNFVVDTLDDALDFCNDEIDDNIGTMKVLDLMVRSNEDDQQHQQQHAQKHQEEHQKHLEQHQQQHASACAASTPCSSSGCPSMPDVIKLLRCMTYGLDIRRVIPKLAEACLQIVNETQIPELFSLLDILMAMKEETLDWNQLPVHIGTAYEVIHSLPHEVQKDLLSRGTKAFEACIADMRAVHQTSVEVHPQITCDGCEQFPITGERYKCVDCADYDLCRACHDRMQEIHPGHTFARVPGLHADVVDFHMGGDAPKEEDDFSIPCSQVPQATNEIPKNDPEKPEKDEPEKAESEVQSHDSKSGKHYYIGEIPAPEESPPSEASCSWEEISSTSEAVVHASALSKLLNHPDKAVRVAANEALAQASFEAHQGTSLDEEPAEEPAETVSEVVTIESEVDEENQIDLEAPKAPEPLSAQVISADLQLGNDAMVEQSEARGDVSPEFEALLGDGEYHLVTQAFRLGRIFMSGGSGGKAFAKAYVRNDGSVQWPGNALLRSCSGPSHGFCELALNYAVPVGDTVELVLDLEVEAQEGGAAARSAWVMCNGEGEPFGPLLILEVVHM